MKEKSYAAIDLKSFYASVECVERGLNPLDTNLVVADESRTEKTICLAVSPSLKAEGIPGRPRLFEVIQKVKEINSVRGKYGFDGKSFISSELKKNPTYELDYITAPPRMALYTKYSTDIFKIYLKYIAPEDIHIYSIDEVFLDVTNYLKTYKMSARKLTETIIADVLSATGITATAGIGTNLYLSKIAMDIVAKKMPPDKNGARIAELDEMSYRKTLWQHTPLTDFWRIGPGYAKKLEKNGLYTMGDIARCSLGGDNELYNEDFLYKLFGVNAELLIDHAWGWEPCTIADIKAYKPENNSLSSGQVLHCPYSFDKARLIVAEMTDLLVYDLIDKGLVTDQMVLTIGYDVQNTKDKNYSGEIQTDRYGRKIPKHSHGTENIGKFTVSSKLIIAAVLNLYDRITDKNLLIRRINVVANHVRSENDLHYEQLDLFSDEEDETLSKEKKMQKTILDLKKKFGKNAVVKGMNLKEGATAMDRNNQIGGHKA